MTLLLHRLPDSMHDFQVTLGNPPKAGLCSDRPAMRLPVLTAGKNGALASERPEPLRTIPQLRNHLPIADLAVKSGILDGFHHRPVVGKYRLCRGDKAFHRLGSAFGSGNPLLQLGLWNFRGEGPAEKQCSSLSLPNVGTALGLHSRLALLARMFAFARVGQDACQIVGFTMGADHQRVTDIFSIRTDQLTVQREALGRRKLVHEGHGRARIALPERMDLPDIDNHARKCGHVLRPGQIPETRPVARIELHQVVLGLEARQMERRVFDTAIAQRLDAAKRLMSIPGIGPLGATALLAAVGDGRQFRKARDLAAWLGLVPRQHSTGGKTTLLGISKRGNPYLRRLIIHGARSCVAHLNRERDRLGHWLDQLEQRMHRNKVIVALANKIARMVWAVLTRPSNLYERVEPAHA